MKSIAAGILLTTTHVMAEMPAGNSGKQHDPITVVAPYRTWRNARIDGGGFVSGMIASKARGGSLFARTDVGGAYRWLQRTDHLSDGAQAAWTFSARGLEETVVIALASPSSGPALISGLGDIGGFTHTDLNASPGVQHSGGNTTGIDFAALAPSIMARVGSKPGKISIDGGKTWNPFPSQEPVGGGRIAIFANGKTIVWMSDSGAFFSNDHGTKWQSIESLPLGSQIASDRVNPLKFYGFFSKDGQFFISMDGGLTFQLSDAKLPGTHGYLGSAMRPVPGFEGHIYLTTQNWRQVSCLHKSTDSGKTFSLISGMNHNEQSLT